MDFRKPSVKGDDERQIYKNFVRDYSRADLQTKTDLMFHQSKIKTKNAVKSLSLRLIGNQVYLKEDDPTACIAIYNKSLCYATYNSENYAIALANRSAMLFKIFEYKKSIEDIDLCLKGKFPKRLKPKVYLRKLECYKHLGDRDNMEKCVKEFQLFINREPRTIADEFKRKLQYLLSDTEEEVTDISEDDCELPVLERNPKFVSASVDVTLKSDQSGNFYYSSSNRITKGQVVLVEKAYTFSPFKNKRSYCQYCLKGMINGIPCNTCVKYMYCGEICKKSAWTEFHQWECYAVQANFFKNNCHLQLALRIILKACYQRGSLTPSDSKTDQYSIIHKLSPILHNDHIKELHAKDALFLVFYLRTRTNFFEHLISLPSFRNINDLTTTIGALIIRHLSQLEVNMLIITDFCNFEYRKRYTGIGMCSSFAFVSHSCDPNTFYYFHDDHVVVKALVDIEPDEKLTYSIFLDQIGLMAERKKFLWDVFRINCNCARCQNPLLNMNKMDSYICLKCRGPAVVVNSALNEKYKCLQCDCVFEMPSEILSKMALADSLLDACNFV